jgi:hypothetical protein
LTRATIDRRTHKGRQIMVVTFGRANPARKPFERVLEAPRGFMEASNRPPKPVGLAAEIAETMRWRFSFPKEWFA